MNALTLHELRLRHAELAHKAEQVRQEWRTLPATGNRALMLGRQVKYLQERADDYGRLIKLADT